MDQNQPWSWRQQRQEEYPPQIPTVSNPFGMFGVPNLPVLPYNFDSTFDTAGSFQNNSGGFGYPASRNPFNQTAPQNSFDRQASRNSFNQGAPRNSFDPLASQNPFGESTYRSAFGPPNPPRQQNTGQRWDRSDSYRPAPQQSRQGDGWRPGQGDSYQPAPQRPLPPADRPPQRTEADLAWGDQEYQPEWGQRRRRRREAPASQDERPRPPRRALAPVWQPREEGPLPFPMDNPALGPFGATRPLQQRNAANPGTNNRPGQAPGIKRKRNKHKGNSQPPTLLPTTTTSPARAREERDAITAPSARSGGIPNPSQDYLTRASFPTMRLPSPKPLLIIIDLNGTLLHRPSKRAPSTFIERPLARAFLQRCLAKHTVAIWSSARPDNVARMCAQLLSPADLSRVAAVWGRDRFGLSSDDYNKRTQCYKRLTRLWADPAVGGAHPAAAAGAVWTQGNTVLIDDSAEKARSEPHNAVTLPEFAGDVDEAPRVLELVEEYLDALAWQMDVSTYIRVKPFTIPGKQPVAAVSEQS